MEIVIGIKIDYGRSLKAELSLCRPHIVEESRRRYLESQREIFSEVRREELLMFVCLVTDKSRFFVGKTVPQF